MAITSKKQMESLFTAHAAAKAPPAATPKGTCTVSAGGIKVTKRHVTEQLCGDVAKAAGGTYTFVPD